MSDLRSKLIRLAHEKPELRPHLLPILKAASDLGFLLRYLNKGAKMGPAAEAAAKEQASMWKYNWDAVDFPEDREVWLEEIDATCEALLKWKKALERSGMTPDAGKDDLLDAVNWSADPLRGGPQAQEAAIALIQAWGMYWNKNWLREIDGTCKVLMDWKMKLQRSEVMLKGW